MRKQSRAFRGARRDRERCAARWLVMVDMGARLDELWVAAGRTEALAAVSVEAYDNASWNDPDPQIIERLAHLLGVTHEAAVATVSAVDRFRTAVADAQPATAGERWTGEGTAPRAGRGSRYSLRQDLCWCMMSKRRARESNPGLQPGTNRECRVP
jgi:hypothetical protein